MTVKRTLVLLGTFVLCMSIALGFAGAFFMNGHAGHADTPSAVTGPSSSVCTFSHATAHGMEGQLTAQYDDNKKLTGWTCTVSSHHVCKAGPDGKWTECTYPPDLMAWPEPVSAAALQNPPVTASVIQN